MIYMNEHLLKCAWDATNDKLLLWHKWDEPESGSCVYDAGGGYRCMLGHAFLDEDIQYIHAMGVNNAPALSISVGYEDNWLALQIQELHDRTYEKVATEDMTKEQADAKVRDGLWDLAINVGLDPKKVFEVESVKAQLEAC